MLGIAQKLLAPLAGEKLGGVEPLGLVPKLPVRLQPIYAEMPPFMVKPVAGNLTKPVACPAVEVRNKPTNKVAVRGFVFMNTPKSKWLRCKQRLR